jgi:signal transduction histidine kinase/ligand-binding sensor domain-containing protein
MLLVPPPSSAQQQSKSKPINSYILDRWGLEHGLPQDQVNTNPLQTKDGFLWMGTQEGLARFDGLTFKAYDRTNTPALKTNWFFGIAEDSSGGVWFWEPAQRNQQRGVVQYKKGEFKSFGRAEGLLSDTTNEVWCTDDGSVWIFPPSGKGVTRYKDGKFESLTTANGLPSDTIHFMRRDRNGFYWIRTPAGLHTLENGIFKEFMGREESLRLGVRGIAITAKADQGIERGYVDSSDGIWFLTKQGLMHYQNGSYSRYDGYKDSVLFHAFKTNDGDTWLPAPTGLHIVRGRSVKRVSFPNGYENFGAAVDRDGYVWLGSNQGIFRFDGANVEQFEHPLLKGKAAWAPFVDKENSVWFGYPNGLLRIREATFTTVGTPEGLPENSMAAVLEDRKGNMWVTYGSNGGITRISGNKITHIDHPLPRFVGLYEGNDGTLYAVQWGGNLFKVSNNKLLKVISAEQVGNATITSVRSQKDGSLLVFGVVNIWHFRNGVLRPLLKDPPRMARFTFLGPDGTIYVATPNAGIFQLVGEKLEQIDLSESALGVRARQYGYADREGTLWIGTNDGLLIHRNGTTKLLTPQDGLFDYSVFGFMEDDEGYLWMTCNRGPSRVLKQDLLDRADGKRGPVVPQVFSTADGMRSRECNAIGSPNIFKRKDGTIAIPTIAGVAFVNPKRIRTNPVPPLVIIEQVVAGDQSYHDPEQVVLPAGSGKFEVHYAGLSFIGSDKVRYKYQLVGYDPDWIDAGTRRTAYYTNLSPGTYRFRAIAANADGVWNEVGASTAITIEPYFYQTTWFLAFGIIFFLTSGPSFYVYRTRSLKRKKEELERLVADRTKELQKSLDHLKETQHQLVLSEKMASLGQLTAGIAHEIKNPLNFITNFATLSKDLTAELRTELDVTIDPARRKTIEELLADLEQNVTKINEHGKRADSIVRGMLLHSRGKAGERQETDINALLQEYTNLAYHGMRAIDQSFNVKIEMDFDSSIGMMSVVPQDLSRAFLNIVNNACYAANDKKKTNGKDFSPVVKVSTKSVGHSIEIRIRDNGNGIPPEIRDRIFNPFFTTKPAGVGTGLGLSLSYDIITQEHHGTLDVRTEPGSYTEFILTIPRKQVIQEALAL